jgi:hypothetical protein
LQIEAHVSQHWWAGFYGNAILSPSNLKLDWPFDVTGGEIKREDFFFNCFAKTGYDIYASTVNQSMINTTNIRSAAVEDIDEWIGIDAGIEYSAANTFNESMTINFGGDNLTVLALRLNPKNESWYMGALVDGSDNLLFVAIAEEFKLGFENNFYNYQLMLPIKAPYMSGETLVYPNVTYHFFPDPVSDF